MRALFRTSVAPLCFPLFTPCLWQPMDKRLRKKDGVLRITGPIVFTVESKRSMEARQATISHRKASRLGLVYSDNDMRHDDALQSWHYKKQTSPIVIGNLTSSDDQNECVGVFCSSSPRISPTVIPAPLPAVPWDRATIYARTEGMQSCLWHGRRQQSRSNMPARDRRHICVDTGLSEGSWADCR